MRLRWFASLVSVVAGSMIFTFPGHALAESFWSALPAVTQPTAPLAFHKPVSSDDNGVPPTPEPVPTPDQPPDEGEPSPDVGHIADIMQQVSDAGNTACELVHCTYIPPNISKFIDAVGKVTTIGDLSQVDALALKLIPDSKALEEANREGPDGTLTPQKVAAVKQLYNDDRAIVEALRSLSPVIAAVLPEMNPLPKDGGGAW